MADLTENQINLLEAAKKSNGGGVRASAFWSEDLEAMLHEGFIEPKKGNVTSVSLYVITRAGREALECRSKGPYQFQQQPFQQLTIQELVSKEASKPDLPPWEL